jgi:hypothetical protein
MSIKDCIDDTVYVVVHAETSYTRYQHLQKMFVKRIQLENYEDLYILPAKASILGPALVVPDMETMTDVSSTDFIATMGRHKWGNYFLRYSKMQRHQRENNEEYESDEDSYCEDQWGFDF